MNSENVNQTGKFDLTYIGKDECQHDFECDDCGCLFTITFALIMANVVEQPEPVED